MLKDTSRGLDASRESSQLGRGCRANEWQRHNSHSLPTAMSYEVY